MKKSKIIVSLIHNNNGERLSYIQPKIAELVTQMREKMSVDFFETCWEPSLKPLSGSVVFLREYIYWKINREWSIYREKKPKFLLFDFGVFIIRRIRNYCFNQKIFQQRLQSSLIEMIVTQKHIYTFMHALESEADYVLMLEDDAIFTEDVADKILHLLESLENDPKIPIYIDLSGGFQVDEIDIDELESGRDEQFRYYRKPVTNTACAYLVNREQLKIFGLFLTMFPWLRYIPIDWMLNKIFILQSKAGIQSHCRHADPTFFVHGSMMGNHTSWKR